MVRVFLVSYHLRLMTFIGELHYIKCITHTSVHTQTHGGNKGGKQEGGNERAAAPIYRVWGLLDSSEVAQWERAGLITLRSSDRN